MSEASDSVPADKDKPEGWIDPEDVQKPDTTPTEPTDEESDEGVSKSVGAVAQEVVHGKWGVGQDRRRRLSEAGYDLKKVEAKVRELLNKK